MEQTYTVRETLLRWAWSRGSKANTARGAVAFLRKNLRPSNVHMLCGLEDIDRPERGRSNRSFVTWPDWRRNWRSEYYLERRGERAMRRFGYIALDDAEAWARQLTAEILRPLASSLRKNWPYKRSETRWAGGEHTVDLSLDAMFGASCATTKAWSSNGKWSGTNSHATVRVTVGALSHFPTLLANGLIVLDAWRIGPREYWMFWVEQGRGVGLKVVSGFYLRGRHIVGDNLARARKKAAELRHRAAVASWSTRHTTRAARVATELLKRHPERVYVSIEDSLEVGNCASASHNVRNQVAERIGASGAFAGRADVLLSIRNDSYSRRAALHAAARRARPRS